jgi:hypothetical protein
MTATTLADPWPGTRRPFGDFADDHPAGVLVDDGADLPQARVDGGPAW